MSMSSQLSQLTTNLTTNRDGKTLARALNSHLNALRKNKNSPAELMLATSYFTAQGWFSIANEIEKLSKVRLLVGCERPLPHDEINQQTQSNDENLFTKHIQEIFQRHERYLLQEYELQPFDEKSTELWRNLPKALRKGNIEVRRYKKSFFHAKTWILKNTAATLGSSNLTYAGVNKNQEANITLQNLEMQQQLENWYEQVWEEAEVYDLATHYDQLNREYSPYEIYLKTLYECFYDEIALENEIESSSSERMSLTNFQQNGVTRARRIINKYKGVLIADTVGLGKTFIAGELMRTYIEQRQQVLLVVPAAMKEIWKNFLKKQLLSNVEPISYEKFANQHRDGDLRHQQELYQLVVIDEAHNYRNPDTTARAQVLRKFLYETQRPRDLVLLTATPVNNSIQDLETLLGYFLDDDALAKHKYPYPSIKAFFKKIKKNEEDGINTKKLEPLIDAVTLKRTRQFVQKEYPDAKLPDENGELKPVTFPERKLKTVRYNFDESLPEIFEQLKDILTCKGKKPPKLTLAIYQVEKYRIIEKNTEYAEDTRKEEKNIIGLIRSLMLKRFESSIKAFCHTCEEMVKKHKKLLDAIGQEKVITTTTKRPPPADNDDEEWEKETYEPAENFDVEALKKDVENDLKLLQSLASKNLEQEKDPKLKKLIEQIAEIARQAREDTKDERQRKNNRKVLIFSYYKDTARWIYEFLSKNLHKNHLLVDYKGINILLYTSGSGDGTNTTNPDKATKLFSPETAAKDTETVSSETECDILVTTDVLSEGKNLQQCRNIISYDLPWNPMRLIQRHGRIDRLLSKHKTVFLHTFFPVDRLREFFDLEYKVRKKLMLADEATGIEATPIEDGAESLRMYSENRADLDNLEQENALEAVEGKSNYNMRTAEEYRMALKKALNESEIKWLERLEEMPAKVGSGKYAEKNGHLFCAKVGESPQPFLRFVPTGETQQPIIADLYQCLELLKCCEQTERALSEQEWKQAFPAWQKALKTIVKEWNEFVHESKRQTKIASINNNVVQFLQSYPPTNVGQEKVAKVIATLKRPWRRHEERELKNIWKEKKENSQEASLKLFNFVSRKNIRPTVYSKQYSKQYEFIEEGQVRPVCWMSLRKK